MRSFTLAVVFVLSAIQAWAQGNAEASYALGKMIKNIVVSDGVVLDIVSNAGDKNDVVVSGPDRASVKAVSVKDKKGTLIISRNVTAQMSIHGEAVEKHVEPAEIRLSINNKVEYITIAGESRVGVSLSTKRLIIKVQQGSLLKGTVNCEALGLFVSGSDAELEGKFRTTKITADSSKIVLSGYEAENSEFIVSGGSLLTVVGKSTGMKLKVSGMSRVEALQHSVQNVVAEISGNSDVFFNAAKTLDITAREKSHVITTGNPKTTANVARDCKFGHR